MKVKSYYRDLRGQIWVLNKMLAGEASLKTQEGGPSIQQIEEMKKLTLNWNIKQSTAAEILKKIPHTLLRYSFVLR